MSARGIRATTSSSSWMMVLRRFWTLIDVEDTTS